MSDVLTVLRRESLSVADQADVIVWGESTISDFALDLDSFRSEECVQQHERYGRSGQTPCPGLNACLLCAGASFVERDGRVDGCHNTAYLVDPNQRILGRYHKRALMPWGEYVAGQQYVPGLAAALNQGAPVVPGQSPAPLISGNDIQLGVLICYEDLLSTPARETVRAGSTVPVNLNNLTIFGRTPALRQHQQMARFRAIENRRVLLRCGVTGLSAVISPAGVVQQQAPTHSRQTLLVNAPLLTGQTIYMRFGDVFARSCLAMTTTFLLLRFVPALFQFTPSNSPRRPDSWQRAL